MNEIVRDLRDTTIEKSHVRKFFETQVSTLRLMLFNSNLMTETTRFTWHLILFSMRVRLLVNT